MPTLIQFRLTPHFGMPGDQISCRCCDTFPLNPDSIRHYQMLEEFRTWYGRAMPINSGYRCPKHNAAVKGEEDSLHLLAIATDIKLPPDFGRMTATRKREFLLNVRRKWYELCDKYEVAGGVGFYNTFFHLDSRPNVLPYKRAFWNDSPYL